MKRSAKGLGPILAAVVFVTSCGGNGATPGTSATPSTPAAVPSTVAPTTPETTPPVTLPVTADIVGPEAGSLIETAAWGDVPVNLVDVLLAGESNRRVADEVAEAIGGVVVGSLDVISYYQIRIEATTEADLTAALEAAADHEAVEQAFPELPLVAAASENSCTAEGPLQDSWFGEGAARANGKPLEVVGLEQAWAAVRAGGVKLNPVKVGVVDTGLYTGSDEISGAVQIAGARPGDTTDQPARNAAGDLRFGGMNHGTGVAHVIGADPANGGMVGVASVLGRNLSISVTDVFSGSEWSPPAAGDDKLSQAELADGTWTSKTLAAILFQIENGATVINLSIGAKKPGKGYRPVAAAFRRLIESVAKSHPRVVFVAAAGNNTAGIDGSNQAPGGLPLPNLITVGAVSSNGRAARFTNYAVEGGEVTLAAPGVKVPMGTGADGKPFHANGTSFSTPMVAGAAALLQSLDPDLTGAEIKEILRATAAAKVEGEPAITIPANLGGGILRVDRAVLRAVSQIRARGDKPKPPLTWDDVDALSGLTATASLEESDTYTVTGVVGAVAGTGTDLVLTLLSEGSIAGDAAQTLTGPGSALWIVVLEDRAGAARVERTDIGIGCTLTLEPPPLDGLWAGEMVIGEVEFLSDEVALDLGDGVTVDMTKEECQALLASSAEPIPMEYNFVTTAPGAGTVSGVAGEGGDDGSASGSWLSTGDSVTFELGAAGADSTITFEGTVGESVIEGSWETTTDDFVITGTFSMTRAG
jgi:hypothetical protein